MGLQWVDLGSLRLSSLPPGGETHRKSHIFQKRRVCDTAYILSLARTWDRTHVRGALFPAALSEPFLEGPENPKADLCQASVPLAPGR